MKIARVRHAGVRGTEFVVSTMRRLVTRPLSGAWPSPRWRPGWPRARPSREPSCCFREGRPRYRGKHPPGRQGTRARPALRAATLTSAGPRAYTSSPETCDCASAPPLPPARNVRRRSRCISSSRPTNSRRVEDDAGQRDWLDRRYPCRYRRHRHTDRVGSDAVNDVLAAARRNRPQCAISNASRRRASWRSGAASGNRVPTADGWRAAQPARRNRRSLIRARSLPREHPVVPFSGPRPPWLVPAAVRSSAAREP